MKELMNIALKKNIASDYSDHSQRNGYEPEIPLCGNLSLIENRPQIGVISDNALREIINLSTDIITVLDDKGTILYESPSIEKVIGYGPNELVGKNAFSFVHKDDAAFVIESFRDGVASPGTAVFAPYRFRKPDGDYVYLESAGTKFTEGPHATHIVVNSRDVTARVENEKKIHRLTAAVEQSSNTIVITDIDGKIQYVIKNFEKLTGYTKEEALAGSPVLLKSGTTSDGIYRELWTTILTGNVWEGEIENKKKNGELYWERIKITPVVDENDEITNFIAMKDDITLEKEKDAKLEHNLKEKELMLKEIHHRVKNNLQIVISLLNLQASSAGDGKLKSQLTISQNRVRSMALIHQMLYRSCDLSKIDMEDYLFSIAGQLLATYDEQKDKVRMKFDAKNIHFSIETAVPFGLLVNELITNSLKHGFPGERKGNIEITLTETAKEEFELNYSEDGVGIPLTLVNGHVLSFGMQLIDMLVSQLDGTITRVASEGTTYRIKFRGSNYQTRFQYS